jgi:hypothetical protein
MYVSLCEHGQKGYLVTMISTHFATDGTESTLLDALLGTSVPQLPPQLPAPRQERRAEVFQRSLQRVWRTQVWAWSARLHPSAHSFLDLVALQLAAGTTTKTARGARAKSLAPFKPAALAPVPEAAQYFSPYGTQRGNVDSTSSQGTCFMCRSQLPAMCCVLIVILPQRK